MAENTLGIDVIARLDNIRAEFAKGGEFALTDGTGRATWLVVEAPGRAIVHARVDPSSTAPVTVRMTRGVFVRGRVVDASGAPVPRALVAQCAPRTVSAGWNRRTRRDR